ncbi:MAG: glycosyltransferase [PVC group bacterium]|nr:glycosyltransferase [PVC group bacterium]
MKITFFGNNKKWGGLANNGGSRTILLSAETLRELGHGVNVVACSDKFTWFPHPPIKHKVSSNTDVVIAISISDVKDIMDKYPGKKLAYWARPWESWHSSEKKCLKLLKRFRLFGGTIMVNSGWQKDYLETKNITSHLVYSGQDIEWKMESGYNQPYDRMVIGCQYSSKPRKGWKEFKKIAKLLGDKYEYVAFGSEKCKNKFISRYLRNPAREKLNEFYRSMDVFFIGNQLEGFLNVGSEAVINGALLICNSNPRSGAHDYCNEETAHMYNYTGDGKRTGLLGFQIMRIMDNLDFTKVAKCQKLIREKIGTRKKNMERMIEVLE